MKKEMIEQKKIEIIQICDDIVENGNIDAYVELHTCMHTWLDECQGDKTELEEYAKSVLEITNRYEARDTNNILLYLKSVFLVDSLCVYKQNVMKDVIDQAVRCNLNLQSLYFVYREVEHARFVSVNIQNREDISVLRDFHRKIVAEFKRLVLGDKKVERIPYEQRNKNLVVVLTAQFIREEHGPTKTALDRCKTLIRKMNKEVLIVNTNEVLAEDGIVPMFEIYFGSFCEEYNNREYVEHKEYDLKIPFFQCGKGSLEIETLKVLVDQVCNLAPEYIVDIGGQGMLGNICNEYIPTLAVGLGPSEVPLSTEQFKTISRAVTEQEKEYLDQDGREESKYIIQSIFTSGLKKQMTTLSKEDLRIYDDKMNIIIVGARLDAEVDDRLLDMIKKLPGDKLTVNFCGIYNGYEKIAADPELKGKVRNLGFQSDILAVLDQMDLYVNPRRSGGGTSGVEALAKGVPVITPKYGDVYVNVKDEFAVDDYDQIYEEILRYCTDKSYYDLKSQKAKERADILLDSDSEFVRIMERCRELELEEK